MKRTLKKGWILVAMVSISLASCSLDPKLTENIDYEKNPISTIEELGANLVGTYSLMTDPTYYGNNIIAYSDVRSDNAYSDGRSNRFGNVSSFGLTTSARYAADTWKQIYLVVSEANRAIDANLKEDDNVKVLKGQAYIIRALAHYDALRIYGQQYFNNQGLDGLGIPYIKKYAAIDAKVVRGTVASNRADIYADLDKGIALLEEGSALTPNVKITKAGAYGLKARIALFFSNWNTADLAVARENALIAMEKSGSNVIGRFAFVSSYSADDAQSNSLFELKQSGVDNPGTDSLFYVYADEDRGYGDIIVNFKVEDLFGSDAPQEVEGPDGKVKVIPSNDIRADRAMINTIAGELRNIGKYPKMASNLKVMRYEEALLIFVEADYRIANGVTAQALEYFNTLKENRLTTFTKLTTYTLDDIRIERQKELLFEGFGFEDLMRFHLPVTNVYGTFNYGEDLLAFPIPQTEINASGIQQNEGY